ncbi:MAG: biotin transporter BioY [Streptococcaceae bacterium]|jgi:biotin transport system substrate-specific component|nr:biotin transporter BioY [Streptococcaceae bacterium]
MKNSKIYQIIIAALFASLIAILAQIVFPIGTVPVTLQTLGVGITASILGRKLGVLSIGIYILLGLIFPVYAGGSMGIHVWFGPTGGFLLSFLLMGWIIGYFTSKNDDSIIFTLMGNILGAFAVLFIGTIWLKFAASLDWKTAFIAGAGVFIPIELGKSVLSSFVALSVKRAIPEKYLLKLKN